MRKWISNRKEESIQIPPNENNHYTHCVRIDATVSAANRLLKIKLMEKIAIVIARNHCFSAALLRGAVLAIR